MTTEKSEEKDWERRKPLITPKNQKILNKLRGDSKENLLIRGVLLQASIV